MTHRGIGIVLVLIGFVALGLITQASAQWVVVNGAGGATTDPSGRTMINGGDPNAMKAMMEQFRARQAQQLKDSLGATDDEWKVLEPKIQKVQESSAAVSSGQTALLFGGRGMSFPMGGDPTAPKSDVQKTAEDLKKLLDDKDSSPADIKAALAAYRDTRIKAKAALDKAREELRAVLTVRQEAVLVARGTLE